MTPFNTAYENGCMIITHSTGVNDSYSIEDLERVKVQIDLQLEDLRSKQFFLCEQITACENSLQENSN